jgi:hypothetical protein
VVNKKPTLKSSDILRDITGKACLQVLEFGYSLTEKYQGLLGELIFT